MNTDESDALVNSVPGLEFPTKTGRLEEPLPPSPNSPELPKPQHHS